MRLGLCYDVPHTGLIDLPLGAARFAAGTASATEAEGDVPVCAARFAASTASEPESLSQADVDFVFGAARFAASAGTASATESEGDFPVCAARFAAGACTASEPEALSKQPEASHVLL